MRAAWAALQLAPILLVVWFTWGFHVEVPFIDQWYFLSFFDRVGAGTATWADVFARHEINGHHVLVPRLLLTALAFATGWSMRAETTLSLLIAIATFLLMARWTRQRGPEASNGTVAAANVLTAWLIFSLAQYWNWLWGFSILLFLIHLFLVTGVALLHGAQADSLRLRLAGAAGCCALATFTMLHGVLTWFALVPCVIAAGQRAGRLREALALWSVATAATLLLFLPGSPDQSMRFLNTLQTRPLQIPTYFLNLLGMPAAFFAKWSFREVLETEVFWPAGAVLLAAFAALCVHFLARATPQERGQAIPWISLGLFSLGYAVANTLGRSHIGQGLNVGIGVFTAIYVTPPVFVSIAVVQLSLLYVDVRFSRWAMPRRFAILAAAAPFAILVTLNTGYSLHVLGPLRARSAAYADARCFEFARYLARRNTCADHRSWGELRLAALERLGFRKFHRGLDFVTQPSASHGRAEKLVRIGDPGRPVASHVLIHGFIDYRDWERVDVEDPGGRAPNDLAVAGRVRFPDRADRPRTVLLTGNRGRFFIAWAEVAPLLERTPEGEFYPWVAPIPDALFPNARAEAWVFDPERHAMIRLDGSVTLER